MYLLLVPRCLIVRVIPKPYPNILRIRFQIFFTHSLGDPNPAMREEMLALLQSEEPIIRDRHV